MGTGGVKVVNSTGDAFSHIDRHAKNVGRPRNASPAEIARLVTGPAATPTQRARAVFTWIASNIDYDVSQYFGRTTHTGDPIARALATGKGVCAGYSSLFQALCESVGIESATISGHGKGFGFDHLPEDPSWQLIEKPISKEAYRDILKVYSEFFEYGIRLVNCRCARFDATGSVEVILEAKKKIEIAVHVQDRGGKRPIQPLAFVREEGGRYAVAALFPAVGDYELSVYGREAGDDGPFKPIIDYAVRSKRSITGKVGFPKTYNDFLERTCRLEAPMEGYLKRGCKRRFSLTVPGADRVVVVTGESQHYLGHSGQCFEGEVLVDADELKLFAGFPGEPKLVGLLHYGTY